MSLHGYFLVRRLSLCSRARQLLSPTAREKRERQVRVIQLVHTSRGKVDTDCECGPSQVLCAFMRVVTINP